MLLKFLSDSRTLLVGVVFFFLVVGGSLLYSWHVRRTTESELAETRQAPQLPKNDKATRTSTDTLDTSPVDFEGAKTDRETNKTQPISNDPDGSTIGEASESADVADAFLPGDLVSEAAPAEDVRVSPFGFGPYPEVPADLPETIGIPWNWSEEMRHQFKDHLRDFELMTRVLIKLWNQGDKDFTGGEIRYNSIVYPRYPNTVYVRYTANFEEVEDGFTEGSSADVSAGRGVSDQDIERIMNGETPPGIRILDMDTDGINAYSFLNLQ